MAGYMGSPEGEKLQENLIQNYTKYKGSAPEGVTWILPLFRLSTTFWLLFQIILNDLLNNS